MIAALCAPSTPSGGRASAWSGHPSPGRARRARPGPRFDRRQQHGEAGRLAGLEGVDRLHPLGQLGGPARRPARPRHCLPRDQQESAAEDELEPPTQSAGSPSSSGVSAARGEQHDRAQHREAADPARDERRRRSMRARGVPSLSTTPMMEPAQGHTHAVGEHLPYRIAGHEAMFSGSRSRVITLCG